MKHVYVCITFKNYVDAKSYEQTRKYKKAIEIQKALGIESLVVDICTSKNRKKANLEELLNKEETTIVVSDVTALGKNEEIASIYNRIVEAGNDILICYYDECGLLKAEEPSTVDLNFDKKSDIPNPVFDMAGYLTPTQYRKTSTRMLDPRIIEGYWQIEQGEKTQKQVIDEIGTSKNTFIRRADEYVGTEGWATRYLSEVENTDIMTKPTKLGEIPEDAKRLYEYLEEHPTDFNAYSMDVICSFAGIDMQTWNKISMLQDSIENREEYYKLHNHYCAMSYHLYRNVLRYRKYLKRLKYRQ